MHFLTTQRILTLQIPFAVARWKLIPRVSQPRIMDLPSISCFQFSVRLSRHKREALKNKLWILHNWVGKVSDDKFHNWKYTFYLNTRPLFEILKQLIFSKIFRNFCQMRASLTDYRNYYRRLWQHYHDQTNVWTFSTFHGSGTYFNCWRFLRDETGCTLFKNIL